MIRISMSTKLLSMASKLLGAILFAWMSPCLDAHDLQTQAQMMDRFVLFQASYEGSEAASFAAVSVHAPDAADPHADAYQTGRTDAEGRFVFIPNTTGKWKITVDDEMGHRVTQDVMVTDLAGAPLPSASNQTSARTTIDRLVIGLSVIFGVTGLLTAFLQRRKTPTAA